MITLTTTMQINAIRTIHHQPTIHETYATVMAGDAKVDIVIWPKIEMAM